MKALTINFPEYVASNSKGYYALISLYDQIKDLEDTNIYFNFKNCKYFDANLSAVLGSIFRKATLLNNTVRIGELNSKLDDVLHRNGFKCKFGAKKRVDHNDTTISYQEFEENKGANFKEYIRDNILRKSDFPELSTLAEKKINESIFELFDNAHTHGACDLIHTCGQYFPEAHPPRIDMTIVDLGQSIKATVNHHRKKFDEPLLRGVEAIEWAIIRGHTTKTGNKPGGLGLDITREFVKLNRGKFQIVSADGFWEYKDNGSKSKTLSKSFPGTIANLEFNLDDKNFYQLKEEISLDDIF